MIESKLIHNHSTALNKKVKQLVINRARNEVDEKESNIKLSRHLSCKVHYEYTYMSSLFSSVEGRTIDNYFIEQRIEKAKELHVYGQLNLSQITFDLEYSSVAHLSTQFKSPQVLPLLGGLFNLSVYDRVLSFEVFLFLITLQHKVYF